MQIEDFSIRLRNGAGNGNPRNGLCLIQAVHWFSGAERPSQQGTRPGAKMRSDRWQRTMTSSAYRTSSQRNSLV